MKILIENDLFDICARLKEIDDDYYVLFDDEKNVYQLHCHNQAHTSYCLTFGEKLDERAILKTLRTRRQNRDLLLEELERGNKWK